MDIHLGSMLSLKLGGIEFKPKNLPIKLNISSIELKVPMHSFWTFNEVQADVNINKPTIQLYLPQQMDTQPSSKKQEQLDTKSVLEDILRINQELSSLFRIKIKDGHMILTDLNQSAKNQIVSCKGIHFNSLITNIIKSVDLSLKSSCYLNLLNQDIPVKLNLQSKLLLDKNKFRSTNTKLKISGLESHITGYMDLSSQQHNWNIKANINDLRNLAVPPDFLTFGNWQGGISLNAKAYTDPQWNAEFDILINKLIGNIKYQKNNINTSGIVKLNSELVGNFKNSKIEFSKIHLDANLDQAHILVDQLFNKPSNVKLNAQIKAKYQKDYLSINNLNLQFHQLLTQLTGHIQTTPKQISDFNLQIPSSHLSGYEKFLLPLSSTPLKGSLSLNSRIKGNLFQPMNVNINIKELDLKNISTYVKYQNQDISLQGPVIVNTSTKAIIDRQKILSASTNTYINLDRLNIIYKDLVRKKGNFPFSLKLIGKQTKETFYISPSTITTAAGNFKFSGQLKNLATPQFRLSSEIKNFKLSRLKKIILGLPEIIPDLSVNMKLKANGQFSPEIGIEKSPIALAVLGNIRIPKYKIQLPKPQATETQQTISHKPILKAGPLAPQWPIVQKMSARLKINMDELQINHEKIKNIKTLASLHNQKFKVTGSIGNFFGGKLNKLLLKADIGKNQTNFFASTDMQNVQLKRPVNLFLPDFKDQISGISKGNFYINLAHPSKDNFLQQTTAQASLKIQRGFISSLKLDRIINKALRKIPGMDKSKMNSKGALVNIDLFAKYRNSILQLEKLDIINPQRDQLQAKGQLSYPKELKLDANLFLNSPEIKASLRAANSDTSGRFILPVQISGSLLDPQLNITGYTLKKLTSNMLKYESQQKTKALKKKAQTAVKKEQQKLKKNVEKELKKLFR